jgi:hypothetical protein
VNCLWLNGRLIHVERVQYPCLRIALGLMQSTHVQTLEVIGGVLLRMRFLMLTHGYLILAFSTADGRPFKVEFSEASSRVQRGGGL